jgi:DNA-binding NtrC family response regulator
LLNAPAMNEETSPLSTGERAVRVLVASNDLVYGDSLRSRLSRTGMEVEQQTVAAAVDRSNTALARVDVMLVEATGLSPDDWRGLDRVRQRSPLVELVLIAADPQVREAVSALRSGVFAVLQHPISGPELARTLVSACTRKRHAEARIWQLNHDRRWTLQDAPAPPGSALQPRTGHGKARK